jgi:hypothetical protein
VKVFSDLEQILNPRSHMGKKGMANLKIVRAGLQHFEGNITVFQGNQRRTKLRNVHLKYAITVFANSEYFRLCKAHESIS